MKVYILFGYYDHEGSEVEGVYKYKKDAMKKKRIMEKDKKCLYDDIDVTEYEVITKEK